MYSTACIFSYEALIIVPFFTLKVQSGGTGCCCWSGSTITTTPFSSRRITSAASNTASSTCLRQYARCRDGDIWAGPTRHWELCWWSWCWYSTHFMHPSAGGHGGVSLARSMMDVSPNQHSPPPPQSSPDWCIWALPSHGKPCGECLLSKAQLHFFIRGVSSHLFAPYCA